MSFITPRVDDQLVTASLVVWFGPFTYLAGWGGLARPLVAKRVSQSERSELELAEASVRVLEITPLHKDPKQQRGTCGGHAIFDGRLQSGSVQPGRLHSGRLQSVQNVYTPV